MKKGFFVLLVGFLFVAVVFSQVTQFGWIGNHNTDRATQMMASHYTHKQVNDISAVAAVITVSTTWTGYLISGVYNPRRDSSAYLQCISQAGDTAIYSIPTESPLGIKPPPISKIISAGSTDSLIFLLQLVQPQ